MIEMLSGASGMSTVERATRCAPESCHSMVARASPGHGGPSGGLASRVHSPTSGSSRLSASSAVGWSIASLLPLVGGCELHQLLVAPPHPTPPARMPSTAFPGPDGPGPPPVYSEVGVEPVQFILTEVPRILLLGTSDCALPVHQLYTSAGRYGIVHLRTPSAENGLVMRFCERRRTSMNQRT